MSKVGKMITFLFNARYRKKFMLDVPKTMFDVIMELTATAMMILRALNQISM